jgi:hypothetical protein
MAVVALGEDEAGASEASISRFRLRETSALMRGGESGWVLLQGDTREIL